MKICILSMQRVPNFGSLLQSYALKCMMEQLGHTVSFLDIEPNREDNRLLNGKRNEFPGEGEQGGTIAAKLKKLDKYTINRLRVKLRAKRQDRKFEEFRTEVLGIDGMANKSQFDCCIIGSDEVFNCLSGAPWGFTTQLFGNVRQADKVITYAASCGATKYENVPEDARDAIRRAFEKLSAISVRDGNTHKFVSQLTETPVLEHLDPVMVADFSEEISQARVPEGLPERYCVIYSYYNRICNEQEIEAIRSFCKRHNMTLVTVGAPQMWIRDHLVLNPFQALKVIQNAEFVITDTFHGTIFSAKYAGRFAIMVRSSNQNKLIDLITRLGLLNHRIESMEQLNAVYDYERDSITIAAVAKAEHYRSLQYLRENA